MDLRGSRKGGGWKVCYRGTRGGTGEGLGVELGTYWTRGERGVKGDWRGTAEGLDVRGG